MKKVLAGAVSLALFAVGCGGSTDAEELAKARAEVEALKEQAASTTVPATTTASPTTTAAPTTTASPTTTAAPTTTASPTTTAAPTTTTTTVVSTTTATPAGLAALCSFDQSVPKIACHASGTTQGSQLRWESNIWGWDTGPSYEIRLEQEYQLVPEVVVTLQQCQESNCETVETTIDTSILVPSYTDTSTISVAASTSVPSTTTAVPTSGASSPAGTGLSVDCNFDPEPRRIWCEASGYSNPLLVSWTAGGRSGYQGSTFEYLLLEFWQLLPETVVTVEDCGGTGCVTAHVTVDTSSVVPSGADLTASCTFDEPERRISCEATGYTDPDRLRWTTNLNTTRGGGTTKEYVIDWGWGNTVISAGSPPLTELVVQLEECHDPESVDFFDWEDCSAVTWTKPVDLQPRGDCPDDFTGMFKTFPLEDHELIIEVGPPGRMQGEDSYKGHGYFRIPYGQNVIDVRLPIDATLYHGAKTHSGGHFREWTPELQHSLRFRTHCEGLWFKFGHLLELSPSVAALFDEGPTLCVEHVGEACVGPTSEGWAVGPLEMSEGDLIATAVGFALTGNASFDFGVMDEFGRVRTAEHERAQHPSPQPATCYYDFFSTEIADYLRSKDTSRGDDPAVGIGGVTWVEEGLCP